MSTAKDYADLYQCDFTPSARDTKLRELAQSYTSRCEAYDRTVCTGPAKNGEVIPVSGRELAMVNRNTMEVISSIALENPEFTMTEILKACARIAP